MNNLFEIGRNIYKAIREKKWLSIEYSNAQGTITKYWIAIFSIDPIRMKLKVKGLHLALYTVTELNINVTSILSASVVDGSYYDIDDRIIVDIEDNPVKYASLFSNITNMSTLDYLSECNKMDSIPYTCDYELIKHFDGEWRGEYRLSEQQYGHIISSFQYDIKNANKTKAIKQIALNILSINTPKGLYVLAYKKLKLDVIKKCLVQDDEITICSEYTIGGIKQSIRKYIDADDFKLLDNFEKNLEIIKDKITEEDRYPDRVDDMPYIIGVARDIIVDLVSEYNAIHEMKEKNNETEPIKAFWGKLDRVATRRKNYPIVLINKQVNLDQLLAIHNAMKYPITYIQGPPGTGKTSTIVNTILSAFFNDKTVLFSAYNNHPIDGVCEKLMKMEYKGEKIPFPILRLGNDSKVLEALKYMLNLYEYVKNVVSFEKPIDDYKLEKKKDSAQLTYLLGQYDEMREYKERKDVIEQLLKNNKHITFQVRLQAEQLKDIEYKLKTIGDITTEDALKKLNYDEEKLKWYLYYSSINYIKRILEPKYEELQEILYEDDDTKKVALFNKYISDNSNLKKIQRIFPIIATTSISAHKIGHPDVLFDLTIMDEASQGNIALSLIPIIRGRNLMMVGDPQQLKPVILLSDVNNSYLMKKYNVAPIYNYKTNSIYKTLLAADAVSNEILLSHHYRCDEHIINFNNKKYYNNKLKIKTHSKNEQPLIFKEIENNKSAEKNTSPSEVKEIVRFALLNKDKELAVITPFVNQKNMINEAIKKENLTNVTCGTVHAFQGDEKDVVLFSLALTDTTLKSTYDWLKNNKELINVATSRARNQLVMVGSSKEIERLNAGNGDDDLYELVNYVKNNGITEITPRENSSRALGIKPYSTATESAFFQTLNHALDNVLNTSGKCVVRKEVAISHVFENEPYINDLFFTGRFDFVVYEKRGREEFPILAIELDGQEHAEDEKVKARDLKKEQICKAHNFELIRVKNTYARRYYYIKEILSNYFSGVY